MTLYQLQTVMKKQLEPFSCIIIEIVLALASKTGRGNVNGVGPSVWSNVVVHIASVHSCSPII